MVKTSVGCKLNVDDYRMTAFAWSVACLVTPSTPHLFGTCGQIILIAISILSLSLSYLSNSLRTCEWMMCWNSGGIIERTAWWVLMRASEHYFIFLSPGTFSSIPLNLEYISSLLTSRSPRAFARVPIPTRVNERDTFILTVFTCTFLTRQRALHRLTYISFHSHYWAHSRAHCSYCCFVISSTLFISYLSSLRYIPHNY